MITNIYIIEIPYLIQEVLIGTNIYGDVIFEEDLSTGVAQITTPGVHISEFKNNILDELDVRDQQINFYAYDYTIDADHTKHKCHCDMVTIMKQGCACGGI